ncbi:hypothetical protein AXG93_3086s1000 [Marchantia polymorpha subsp. ruderalis]|uniref:Uncharacterized protein n=1 Tax=Marchantia polymorpha subsp. ruderalis TaxID=1480154 RepID=A0A176VWL1_MARPO|nr:hypothetical protein AXG93_3086s1000 [Marchantia polymorpha subsp. ruderalis]
MRKEVASEKAKRDKKEAKRKDFKAKESRELKKDLIEDNNAYRKLLNTALKRAKRSRTHKLPRVYQPLTKMGYDVLIGRPWFYGAKVKSDWHKRSLQFRDPNNKAGPKITVPWERIPHEGETPSTSSGYTLEEETTTSDSDTNVHYMEFYEVDEEEVDVAGLEEVGPEDSE